MRRLLTLIILLPLYAYRYSLGLLLRRHCRFYPSCSGYAIEAIQQHGPWRGLIMAIKRVGRCHPGSHGGIDLVPGHQTTTTATSTHKAAS